jgi:beta-lactamase regulating signal transducer with metallopeptidase domain
MNPTYWLSPSTMHALGWTLLHSLWQDTALAALAALLLTFFRRASIRYALALATLLLMLAAPVATFLSLTSLSLSLTSASAISGGEPNLIRHASSALVNGISAATRIAPAQIATSLDSLPLLVEAWLLGIAFFSLRSAGGFLLLERERRKQSSTVSAQILAMCQTLQRQLGIRRAIRYCECAWLQAPAVIGWLRPIVLLPVTALSGLSEEQLESVVAHELAHIRRLDALVNIFQVAAESLLFYHPAVWWLNQRIRAEREHCCDDIAIALCGNPLEYARALTIMEEWRSAPAFAMAVNGSRLSHRIFRVLGIKPIATRTRRVDLASSLLCLGAALLSGHMLLRVAYPSPTVHAGPNIGSMAIAQQSAATPAATRSSAKPTAARTPTSQTQTIPTQTTSTQTTQAQPAQEQPATSGSYIEGMKAALGDLTVDQLIALKIQDVTPEYVRGLREQGLHPNPETVLAMRIQGVTPEYVQELRALGIGGDDDRIVAMKIQGVDAAYLRGLKEAGVQPGVDQLIAMKIQGVTPEYVRGLHDQGLQPDNDQIVAMRIQGVTTEFVHDIRALGLNPTVDQIIAMQIQGVTPEFVKSLQSAGFKIEVDGVISAKIQGVTEEFIQRAVKHGFKNLTLQKLIQLKQVGVLDSPADI